MPVHRKASLVSGAKRHRLCGETLKTQGRTEARMVPFGIATSALFALLLSLASPVRGQGSEEFITVRITGNNVTLTCPTPEKSLWKEKGSGWEDKVTCSSTSCTIEGYQGTQHNGRYRCGQNGPHIYLQVKECPGCVEMDVWVVTGIIVANLLVTLGVLTLTYHCSRKRAARFGGGGGGGPAAGGPRARPRGQREDRPPPVPNPDYEPIRKGQREVYAGLEPRAF